MDQQQERVFTPLSDDFKFTSTSRENYKPAPVKKLLKANIFGIDATEQIDNFQKTPDGKDNPNYGKPQKMYVVKFKLNDPKAGEANGQVYSKWVSEKVSERSGLGKISDAVFGSPEGILQHSAGDLIGAPLQIVLVPGKKDPERLTVDVDKLMPAADDQERLNAEVVLEDIPEDDTLMSDEELDKVFSK